MKTTLRHLVLVSLSSALLILSSCSDDQKKPDEKTQEKPQTETEKKEGTPEAEDKQKEKSPKEGDKDQDTPGNKDEKGTNPEVKDPTQNKYFINWEKETQEGLNVNTNVYFNFMGESDYKYIGFTLDTNNKSPLEKEMPLKSILDMRRVFTDPGFKGVVRKSPWGSITGTLHPSIIEVGKHIIEIATMNQESIAAKVETEFRNFNGTNKLLFISDEFTKGLYSSALGTAIQGYGSYVIDAYYQGFISCFYSCLIPKAMQEDINPEVKQAFEKLTGKLDQMALKKYIRTNGDLFYYHIALLGGSGKVTPDDVIDPETGELLLHKWGADVKESNGHLLMLKPEFLSPVSKMILEGNFRERLSDNNKTNLPTNEIKPFIEIVRIKPDNKRNLYDVGACLYTRNGDRVLLTKYLDPSNTEDRKKMKVYESNGGFSQAAKTLQEALSKIFTLEIKVNSETRFNNHKEEKFFYSFCLLNEKREAIPIKKYFISKEKRFVIYSDPREFEGVTFFATDETLSSEIERMTSLYGIKEWVKHLPEEKFKSLIYLHHIKSSRYAIGL